MQRLSSIEGFRAYLALWVIIDHSLECAGYRYFDLGGLKRLLMEGWWAVDVFVIISGFVIFFLLDKQQENYRQFITRRFFRLFPLAFLLFLAAIPLSKLRAWNVINGGYLQPETAQALLATIDSWWSHLPVHTALHTTLLHGVIPEIGLHDAPGAFLEPAWSISLEWQFYLVAPFAYFLVTRSGTGGRSWICGVCLALFLAARTLLPAVRYDAFLPFHIEFFFLGGLSFFIYKRHQAGIPGAFATALALSVFLFVLGVREHALIPVCLWVTFFGLMLEPATSLSSRALTPLFTNPVTQFAGKISYSIYLGHILVIFAMQYALIKFAPGLPREKHGILLFLFTLSATIPLAALLYRFVELPGMQLGKKFAAKPSAQPAIEAARAA